MKLKEMLEEIARVNYDRNLYIGTEEGSGYVLIGKVDEIKAEVDNAFTEIKNEHQRFANQYSLKTECAVNKFKELPVPKNLKQAEKIWQSAAELVRVSAGMVNHLDYLEKYEPVLDREVIHFTTRIEDGKAIIVKGKEVGKFWCLEEKEQYYAAHSKK